MTEEEEEAEAEDDEDDEEAEEAERAAGEGKKEGEPGRCSEMGRQATTIS